MVRGVLYGLVAACLMATPAAAEPLPAPSVVQDLTFARDVWAVRERSFSPEARTRMLAFLGDQIAHARPMERTELALVFSEAQAMSGNDHTQSDYLGEPDLFHSLPVSFWLFPEGAMITRAHPSQADLLGAKILRIGGVSVPEAGRRVAKYISGTNARHRFLTPSWLTRMEVLEAVGLADRGAATLDLQLPDGRMVTRVLGVAPTPDPAAASPTWRQSMVPGKGPNPWPHVLDRLPTLPLYLQAPDELTATSLENDRVLYVRSTSLSPYTDDAFAVQLKAYLIVDKAFKSGHTPTDVVVDLRYNGGGNFLNITNLTTELVQLIGPRGHVYVITGRATNSAAIVFTALLKAGTHGRTTIVGEEASDNLWFWSEGQTLQAPASKLPLHYTDGFHDWAHGCTDRSKCYWPAMFHGVAVGSISPDTPIDITYADYVAGRDPALEAALARAQSGR
ncbi:hypothetical protein [Phenylobacterium sp.]|uniref:hypothetical protein n=1 Tax=Phenylobacterium sp. TaxID=1871053 RepID=UPI002C386A56|nr:hypothetical protein [Phenylobacterium sp.]HLZ74107.1 hypothetical protein [Phenylobacterium sp.]